jgi:hypothetical protein
VNLLSRVANRGARWLLDSAAAVLVRASDEPGRATGCRWLPRSASARRAKVRGMAVAREGVVRRRTSMHRSLILASVLVALPAAALAQPSATPVGAEAPAPVVDAAPPAATPAPAAAAIPDTDAAVSGPAPLAPAAAPTAPAAVAPAAAAPPSAAPPSAAPPSAAPPSAAPLARPAPARPFPVVAPVHDTPVDRGLTGAQAEDAALHRAYVAGTALTVPRGAVVADVRQPLFPVGTVGLNVGITDRWQVSGDLLWAMFFDEAEGGVAWQLGTKLQIVRAERFALALHGSIAGAEDDHDDDESALIGGVIASACLDASCRALLTGHLSAVVATDDLDDDDCYYDDCYDDTVEIPIVAGGSLIAGTDSAKLVLEVHAAGDDHETGVGAYAGIRFPGRKVSFDAGLIAGLEDDDGGVLPLPLFALSGRL